MSKSPRVIIPQPQSTFLSLPAELRQPIYTILLTLPPPASRGFPTFYVNPSKQPQRTAVLSASRLVYLEALSLLYTLNTFQAHSTLLTGVASHPPHYVPIFNPMSIKMIKRWHIHVRLDVDARFNEEQVTNAFTGAEELTIETSEAMFRSSQYGVLMLFKGVRGVKRCQIKGGVEKEVRTGLEELMRMPMGWKGDETGGLCGDRWDAGQWDAWRDGNR